MNNFNDTNQSRYLEPLAVKVTISASMKYTSISFKLFVLPTSNGGTGRLSQDGGRRILLPFFLNHITFRTLLCALWTLCSVSVSLFSPVYCRRWPLLGLCSAAQPCPFTLYSRDVDICRTESALPPISSTLLHSPPSSIWTPAGVKCDRLH